MLTERPSFCVARNQLRAKHVVCSPAHLLARLATCLPAHTLARVPACLLDCLPAYCLSCLRLSSLPLLHRQDKCSAADCPYLHVNYSTDAPCCRAFLRGYCPLGAACCQRHVTLKMARELKASSSGQTAGGTKVSALGYDR